MLRRTGLVAGVHQGHVAAGPLQAVTGAKAQALGVEVKAVGALAAAYAPRDGFESQRLEFGAEAGIHVLQRHVGCPAGDRALAHVGPGAQRAVAARQFHAQRVHADILPHAGGIDAGELGEQLPGPGVEVAGTARQQGLAEHAPDAEAVTPFSGRRGVEPQQVPAVRVALKNKRSILLGQADWKSLHSGRAAS